MKFRTLLGATFGLAAGLIASSALAQAPAAAPGGRDYNQEMEDALRAAKTAAGFTHLGTFNRLCILPPNAGAPSQTDNLPGYITNPASAPAREAWYAPPYQIYDNLYWLGGSQHSGWLLTSPEGHILIDTQYPYNSKELILDGMATLGLDPMDIKYIVISHAHGDHIGGVQLVQEATGNKAVVVMGTADWADVDKFPNRFSTMTPAADPALRMAVSEPVDITVGPNTLHVYPTPGHTPGTLSYVFDVMDNGNPVTVAYAGGTAFNFQTDVPDPGIANLERYRGTQESFAKITADAGATVLISNHSEFDQAYLKARAVASRSDRDPSHPFEIGADWVARYFQVMINCTNLKIIGL